MSYAADDLEIYLRNDRTLYDRYLRPAYAELALKKVRGTYTRKDAELVMSIVASYAAEKYHREHGRLFGPEARKETGDSLADYFEAEYKLGNMDYTLPKGVKSTSAAKRGRSKRR